ncbi:mid region of cactin-domain-containing protein [Russula vinacea]|nr:mid region of cactin-domain-containing protein [Russula vinacea]
MGRDKKRTPSPRGRSHDGRSQEHEHERRRDRSRDHQSSARRGEKRGEEYDSKRRQRSRDRSGGRNSDEEDRHEKSKRRKRDKSEERKARKAEKKRLRDEEEMRQVAELSIYSATDNPFHDVNLGQQFRWHKKNEREKKMGLSPAEAQRKDVARRQEAKEELERLNRRRAEREAEQRLREEEEVRMQRLAESAQMAEWIAKDGDFQLEQERNRAAIRVKEKRAKAIDFLALNLRYVNPIDGQEEDSEEAGLEIDLDEPYNILDNLSPDQVHELHDDIEHYLSLEKDEANIEFWTVRPLGYISPDQRLGREAAAAVEADINAHLQGKSYDHLLALQRQIQAKLSGGGPVDIDYWEGLLKKLLVWKSKARLKSLHEVVVRNRLEQLRKRQRDEALQAQEELLEGVANVASKGKFRPPVIEAGVGQQSVEKIVEPYERGMSPGLVDITRLTHEERHVDIVLELDDRVSLMKLRRSVADSRFITKAPQPTAEIAEVETASGADLASEALNIVRPTAYNWEDKYRPRKPRYFNRVHTGYEWNNTDNPPPKVVQGYKFNIFYPDLIDKSKAPTYKIVKEPGNEDTVLLHFSAGPPYEDIAFRIVNREWEYSHKRLVAHI